MKKLAAVLFVMVIGAGSLFAQDIKISVISNGNSVINVKAYHYIKSYSKSTGRSYDIELVHNLDTVDWSESDFYIVLNTGTDGSLDAELLEILESGNPQDSVLVTLIKNREELSVNFDNFPSNPDIDAVSAASLWRHPGIGGLFSGNADIKEMHNQWIEYIFTRIDKFYGDR